MGKLINLSGRIFGRITVISQDGVSKSGKAKWHCACICGTSKTILGEHLLTGRTVSCGCYGKEATIRSNSTHGQSGTKEYNAWCSIQRRCYLRTDTSYDKYGARGIKVCDQWRNSFEAFYSDMGPAPSPTHSVERINNDGNYEPSNCKWATAVEQANNRRCSRLVKYNGEIKTMAQWAVALGVSYATVVGRYKRNKTLKPFRIRKPKREYTSS